jgi:putative transposase
MTAPAFTISQIAEALSISKRSAERRSERQNWPYTEETVRGGKRRLYAPADLPRDVCNALTAQILQRNPVPALAAPQVASTLPAQITPVPAQAIALRAPERITTDAERAQEHAANLVIALLDRLRETSAFSLKAACRSVIEMAQAGRLTAPELAALKAARDGRGRSSLDGLPSVRTLERWAADQAKGHSLLPQKPQADWEVKPWYGLAMALLQRPQGSSYKWVTDQIHANWNPAWGEPPSYHTVRRVAITRFSAIDQLKGRLTGSALRAHRHYHPRTAEGMYPWQEVHADGWNTHFTAPHPITGEFVTLEVWHFHDVATRYVPPPGIGFSETYECITAGLERCVRVGGIPAILQTDSTKVVKRSPRFTQEPFVALTERAGFDVVHPKEVGNSQANGICENFNTSYLDKRSRELATYQGKGMDSLSLKRVKKITAKMTKAIAVGDGAERDRLAAEARRMGKGHVFTSFDEACQWLCQIIEEYNDRPHRSLPKVTDPVTGQRRHQTPREALQAHIDAGWQPVALNEEHLVDLFRPHVKCRVTREAISPVGNRQRYHAPELGHWNDQDVMAAIDPMDWRQVWVKTLEGQLITTAHLVQASGYRAQSSYEIAEAKRAKAQLRRLGHKVDLAEARMTPVLDMQTTSTVVIGGRVVDANTIESVARIVPAQPAPEKPLSAPVVRIAPEQRRQRSDMTVDEIGAEWHQIDEQIKAGIEVTERDHVFHERWPATSQGRVFLKRQAKSA